jgi:predicted small integral membrane protein
MLTTFVVCGFLLHDLPAWAFARRALPPGATIAFALFGLGTIVGEWFRMDMSRLPMLARAAINIAYLAGCVSAMLLIVRWL